MVISPMLLFEEDESELEFYLSDPHWMLEPKYDGRRAWLWTGDKPKLISRGNRSLPIPESMKIEARYLPTGIWDGEFVGNTFYVFDLLEYKGANLRKQGAELRVRRARIALKYFHTISIVATLLQVQTSKKRELAAWLRAKNFEGLVFKKIDGPYLEDDWSKDYAVKIKFLHTAICCVAKRSTTKVRPKAGGGKLKYGNCELSVDTMVDGRRIEFPVGKCSVPPNIQIAKGDIVKVKYLYFKEGLVQPRIIEKILTENSQLTLIENLRVKGETI